MLQLYLVAGLAIIAAASCQLNNSETAGQCVSRDEFDKVKDEIDSMRRELDDWQNETLFILKKHLLQNSDSLSSKVEELHEDTLQEVVDELQAIRKQGEEVADSVDSLKEDIGTLNTSITALVTSCRGNSPAPGTYENPIHSCKHLSNNASSGHYWLRPEGCTETTEVYCDMSRHCCGTTGGWMRIAHIDMTDPTQQCPPGFRLITEPKRTCGGNNPSGGFCTSVTFPVHDYEYQKVCGKVIGYQYNKPEAFYLGVARNLHIDEHYLDGVSITHGRPPRKHIWSFAAAAGELYTTYVCPCTNSDNTARVPSFVGTDYFCETASYGNIDSINSRDPGVMFTQDPLWDGEGCGPDSTCCQFNNPPWFCKQLPASTTDSIELRICSSQSSTIEDSPLEHIELYVQ